MERRIINFSQSYLSGRAFQRTCVACRMVKPKLELIRLVVSDVGAVEIDWFQKARGRGVYVCMSQACWEPQLKKRQLERALRTNISQYNWEQILNAGKGFCKTEFQGVGV